MPTYLKMLEQMTPTTGRTITDAGTLVNVATMWNDVWDTTNSVLKTSATISGDVNVDSTSIDTSGYVGKASGTNADFTTAYTAATTLTVSGLPSEVVNLLADDIVTIVQIATTGAVTNTYSRDDVTITVASNVITVTGATFATTDTFVVYTNIQRRLQLLNYDSASGAALTNETSPIWSRQIGPTVVDVTNETDGTNSYYLDMTGYSGLNLQMIISGGSGTMTVTIEATAQDDGTAAASCTYRDVTADVFGSASYTATDFLFDDAKTLGGTKFVKVKTVSSTGAANDADITVYAKKLY